MVKLKDAHSEIRGLVHILQRISQEVSDSMFGVEGLDKLQARALGIRDNALHLGEDLQVIARKK